MGNNDNFIYAEWHFSTGWAGKHGEIEKKKISLIIFVAVVGHSGLCWKVKTKKTPTAWGS